MPTCILVCPNNPLPKLDCVVLVDDPKSGWAELPKDLVWVDPKGFVFCVDVPKPNELVLLVGAPKALKRGIFFSYLLKEVLIFI